MEPVFNVDPEEILAGLASAENNLTASAAKILANLNPPAGPFAMLSHGTHAVERLRDLQLIVRRFYANRRRLLAYNRIEDRLRPDVLAAGPLPEPYASAFNRSQKLTHELRLDFETFYVFADLFLDQLAIFAAYLTGLRNAERVSFESLVSHMDREPALPPALQALKERRWEHMLWLRHQLRYYRNMFVVHLRRPWQRGSSMPRYGYGFQLWTPSPRGWLDDAKVDEEIRQLFADLSAFEELQISALGENTNPREALRVLHEHIGSIPDARVRKRIEDMRQKIGGATPDFSFLARAVGEFAQGATSQLVDDALQTPESINWGPPAHRDGG